MYKIEKLTNGLRLITAPMRGTKTATILVMVGTGSKYESRRNNGISHFLEHMFFKGTRKRPSPLALAADLDSLGGESNAFTGKEYTGYWIKTSAEKIEKAMEIVSDMLINSEISQKEIEREKGVIIEEFNMYLDNPMMRIEDVFETCLYGDTPAGWDTMGTKKNILSFQRQDFLDYFEAQYNEKNTFVCLAGNISERTREKIDKYFSAPKFARRGKAWQEKEKVKESQEVPGVLVEYKKTDQAHVSLGVRAHSYGNQEKIFIKMISVILGGSMSSRLFTNLRAKNGLAYYVSTSSEVYTDSGYVSTQAGVPVGKLEKAIEIILAEYKKIKTDLVGAKELQRAKDLFTGRATIQMEASNNLAEWYGRQAVMIDAVERVVGKNGDEISSPAEYLEKINRITAADIKRAAKEIFTDKSLNLAVIGPFKDKNKFDKLLKL